MEGQKRDILAICVALFVLFFCIAVLFPYTGDDWTWGSDAGVRDLERFFDGLNGRYAGNLLVMALTRNKLLDAVIMACSYTLVCYFCYEYVDCKSKMLIWLAAVLFYIMPKEIWVQSVVWTSGFSNYVPSTLFTAAFFLSARKLVDMTQLKMEGLSVKTVWMFGLGFLGALFLENMKLFLPLFCVAGSLMPLLVVRPIGARCVFSGYFFMMVFTVELAAYLRIRVLPEVKWLQKLVCLIVIMQTLAFINIYYPVYHCENVRSVFLKRQIEDGKRSVLICDLPNRDYLWNSDISIESLAKRYRQFHNLDKDIQFGFVPFSDLKSIAENYK